MNLTEWAKLRGVSKSTAHKWWREGKMPVPAVKVGGLVLVDDPSLSSSNAVVDGVGGSTVVYARVSSSDQKEDLERQVGRVSSWASDSGLRVDRVVTEVGSALNGHRRKFLRLLEDPSVGTILVEHRDRFCRFGVEYIEAALKAQGRQLVVVDPDEVDDDIVRDMTELLTSMCARLYGKRSAKNRAQKAVQACSSPG